MSKEECRPGGLVEGYGSKWIIGEIRFQESPQYVWCWPATKKGKQDQRKNGQYLNPEKLRLAGGTADRAGD